MLNLQKRLHWSFALALALVFITGATAIYYIRQFDVEVHKTLVTDIELAESGEALRSALEKATTDFEIFVRRPSELETYDAMVKGFKMLMSDVELSQSISLIPDNIALHEEIVKDGKSLVPLMEVVGADSEKRALFRKQGQEFFTSTSARLSTIFAHRREEMAGHRIKIDKLFGRAQQNQILIIFVVLIGGIFLAIFMPYRTVLPVRKMLDAFHEAWECNLSARLPAHGHDELGDLARNFNRMMTQLEELDEMKVKRIAFERRRFEVLANALDIGVIMATIEGKMIFLNAPAYRVFNLTSTQVVNKDIEVVLLPEDLKEMFKEVISTKQRMEDLLWDYTFKTKDDEEVERSTYVDILPVRTHAGELVNLLMLIKERDVPVDERLFKSEAKTKNSEK